ncbi:PREDICTED: syntaxin-17 [Papilio xuthus]|uniref:Syntaxin-17 n=1 Tax=Papilio xuthus TaxID=66420 RepID=A0AAJ6YYH9_PAPXU|nr:PREDICTED: syntaxin-17 [Papilio xuthus]
MEEAGKLSLKRVELSLTKFNEVAIPHHLDLLRQHKTNIIKYGESGDTRRLRAEQTHARRVAGQLRALLAEMDALRAQVREEDRARFDAMTQRTRDLTLRAIVDYLGVIERSCRGLVGAGREGARRGEPLPAPHVPARPRTSPLAESSPVTIRRLEAEVGGAGAEAEAGSARSTDSEAALREREAVLRGWGELQEEVRALHDAWRHVHEAARLQRERVQSADGAVETAAQEVTAARQHLSVAQRWVRLEVQRAPAPHTGMSVGLASAGCAVLGAAVGGPVGLLAGAKAGARENCTRTFEEL